MRKIAMIWVISLMVGALCPMQAETQTAEEAKSRLDALKQVIQKEGWFVAKESINNVRGSQNSESEDSENAGIFGDVISMENDPQAYIFCVEGGKITAHQDPSKINQSVGDMKDAQGHLYLQVLGAKVEADPSGVASVEVDLPRKDLPPEKRTLLAFSGAKLGMHGADKKQNKGCYCATSFGR
jgi:hypothetical protein